MIKEFQNENRCYSNFWLCPVKYEGVVYPSAEHAYQAAKFTDKVMRETIRKAPTPGKAKMLGNKFKARDNWDALKVGIMFEIVRAKFTQNYMLRKQLLETGNEELQEGNRHGDIFWGIDLNTGKGENHLGKILMKVREELR